MSTKQFISAEEHLAKLGLTEQQALNFIVANVEQPEVIYAAVRQAGVTNAMLSDITNISATVISGYFESAGFNPKRIDDTSTLINRDIGELESLVDFNTNIGNLSTNSLRDQVISSINVSAPGDIFYDFFLGPSMDSAYNDNIFDAEELGVQHLGNISATDENLESLFYGTLINIFSVLDETELDQIKAYPKDGDPEAFQSLIDDSLSDEPAISAWTVEELASLVIEEAIYTIEAWDADPRMVGILDASYVGGGVGGEILIH